MGFQNYEYLNGCESLKRDLDGKIQMKNWPHLEIDPRTPLYLLVLRGGGRDFKVSGLI